MADGPHDDDLFLPSRILIYHSRILPGTQAKCALTPGRGAAEMPVAEGAQGQPGPQPTTGPGEQAPTITIASEEGPAKFSTAHPLFHTQALDALPAVQRPYAHNQNEMLACFRQVDALRGRTDEMQETSEDEDGGDDSRAERLAVSASFSANVVLFAAKVVAALMTGSMVVLVSTLDSALDLLSGGILFVTAVMARKSDPLKYPLGKARMEPLGIVVFSTLMGMSSLLVLVEALKILLEAERPASESTDVALSTALILGGVVIMKAGLWVWCSKVQSLRGSATVAAYSDDHRNDAISNAVSVVAFCLAQFTCSTERDANGVCPSVELWYIDPGTAIALSVLIFANWVDSGRQQLTLLVGYTGE